MSFAARCVWSGEQDETVDTELFVLVECGRVECSDRCHGHLEGAELCGALPTLMLSADHLHRLSGIVEVGIEQIPAVGSLDSATAGGLTQTRTVDGGCHYVCTGELSAQFGFGPK